MSHMLRLPAPRRIYNEKGVKIYEEIYPYGGGSCETTYNDDGLKLYHRGMNGWWYKYTRDKYGNVLTYKDSDGYIKEYTRDEEGNVLSYKDYYEIRKGFNKRYIIQQLKKLFNL